MSKRSVLYIDGENCMFAVAEILKSQGLIRHKSEIHKFSIQTIVQSALSGYKVDKINFYAGKINIPKQVPELVPKSLTNEGVDYIMAGQVRLQDTKTDAAGNVQGVFKEKGTDVRIAVDMVAHACDDSIQTALLLSSDSDMQPAVKELKRRSVTVVYIGFENSVNDGLSTTTDKTIIIRATDVVAAWNAANNPGASGR
jgi:uncharacterized LabA/DUF88 family protein